MRTLTALLLAFCALFAAHIATAQTLPAPVYVKKAVFVRIHFDSTFYNYWSAKRVNVSALVQGYFNDVRTAYKTQGLHNIDLYLLDDFVRTTGPMILYYDPAPQMGGDARLVQAMIDRLRTGDVTRTVNGTTHALGRTVNWVFVHQNSGGYGGMVTSTPAIATSDASLFISTAVGDFTDGQGVYHPLQEQRREYVLEGLIHEMGHIIGGQHEPVAKRCETRYSDPELMCSSRTGRQLRFGSENQPVTERVQAVALNRCNSAFPNTAACENAVINYCATIADHTQIPACISINTEANCRNICTNASLNARRVISDLPTTIGTGVVNAGALGP